MRGEPCQVFSTANDNRWKIGCSIHSSKRGASQARKHALAIGQDSAALSGRFISPPDPHCQRLLSTNRRIMQMNPATQRSLDFSGLCAVLEPQSCDVLPYDIATESSNASGGCRHSTGQG